MVKKKAPVKLTGGGGFVYEDHVAARLLLDMLAGTNSLGSDFGVVERINWQARDMGWLADDLVVSCKVTDRDRTIGLSIKSDRQVTSSGFPDSFVEIAWAQWLGVSTSRKLQDNADAMGLITGSLAAEVEMAWSGLLPQLLDTTSERIVARLSASDENEGSQASQVQRQLFGSFHCPKTFNADANETAKLLNRIRLLHLDYGTTTSRANVHALSDCQRVLSSGDKNEAAALWGRLVGIAAEKRKNGGSVDLSGLLALLRDTFSFHAHPDYRSDWEALNRHSRDAMEGVRLNIAGLSPLARDAERKKILDRLSEHKICLLAGESGSGKSAMARSIAETHYPQALWLDASSLDCDTMQQCERQLGVTHPLVEILRSAATSCLVVFDALEGYSPRALKLAAKLIQEIGNASADHIHCLLTMQSEAASSIMIQLAGQGITAASLEVTALTRPSEQDVQTLLKAVPQLAWSSFRSELRPVLTNLKILDWLVKVAQSGKTINGASFVGLTALIDLLWEYWIEGRDADNLARSDLLIQLAVQEAETWSSSIPRRQIGNQVALQVLIKSDLVRRHDERIRFSHDLLGDWARMRVLTGEAPMSTPEHRDRAAQPRWHRAVRLYGQRILEQSTDGHNQWQQAIAQTEDGSEAGKIIRALFLESLFLSGNAATLLERVWPVLAANNGKLLNDLLKRFLYAATLPDPQAMQWAGTVEEASRLEHIFRVPFWPYWGAMLSFLHAHRQDVAKFAPLVVAEVCSLWLQKTPIAVKGQPWPWRQEAAEIALATAREIQACDEESHFFAYGKEKIVYEAALYAAPELPEEIAALCLELAKRRDLDPAIKTRVAESRRKQAEERKARQAADPNHAKKMKSTGFMLPLGQMQKPWPDGSKSQVARAFRTVCLESGAFISLIRVRPDEALEVLLAICIEAPHRDDPYAHPGLLDYCSIEHWMEGYPPMYFRGPFLMFLREAPEHGLSFVLKLINFATKRAEAAGTRRARSSGASESKGIGLDIVIDGKKRRWIGIANTVFRWHNGWPHASKIVPSVLMALERWLYEELDQGKDITPWLTRIMAESESLAFAGVLVDIGKKNPTLFTGQLKPFLSVWQLHDWDMKVTLHRYKTDVASLGWGLQQGKLLPLVQEWYAMPHRQGLMRDIAIELLLTQEDMHPFFDRMRSEWTKLLDVEGEPNELRLLIERFNPENYSFTPQIGLQFQWPEEIEQENAESLRKNQEKMYWMGFPFQCRKIIDEGTPLPEAQIIAFWERLQALDTTPPLLSEDEDDEPLLHVEDIQCAAIAVLLVLHMDWLLADTTRMEWCRQKLAAILETPPPRQRFDSEMAIGSNKWDAFSAECGVLLLARDRTDAIARALAAAGVTAYHYETMGITMLHAFRHRKQLGDDFDRMQHLALQWSAINSIRWSSRFQSEEESAVWQKQCAALIESFINSKLPAVLPDIGKLNADAAKEIQALRILEFPELANDPRRAYREMQGKREKLYTKPPALDLRAIVHAFAWLDITAVTSSQERTKWLALIRQFFTFSLASIPTIEDSKNQDIEGLPTDFDHWIYGVAARAIPHMSIEEEPAAFWKALLDLGTPAHHWVERFFWEWFTRGVRSAESPEAFVKLWGEMVSYALAHPAWDTKAGRTYDLDDMVFELLGFHYGVSSVGGNEKFSAAMATMVLIFDKAAKRWFSMPRIVNGFLNFAVQPGASTLLIPGIGWLADIMPSFDKYDWKEQGMEDNLAEFLRACWERASQKISSDSNLRAAFTTLLTTLASRGSPIAIALSDQILGSIPG
jgi:hypothetical protein